MTRGEMCWRVSERREEVSPVLLPLCCCSRRRGGGHARACMALLRRTRAPASCRTGPINRLLLLRLCVRARQSPEQTRVTLSRTCIALETVQHDVGTLHNGRGAGRSAFERVFHVSKPFTHFIIPACPVCVAQQQDLIGRMIAQGMRVEIRFYNRVRACGAESCTDRTSDASRV